MDSQKMSSDRLMTMSEDELHGRIRSMFGMISRFRFEKRNTESPETELCYLQRELEIRSRRREAHRAWLQNNQ